MRKIFEKNETKLILVLCVIYMVLPLYGKFINPSDKSLFIISLFIVNPIATIVCNYKYGKTNNLNLYLCLITSIIWLPISIIFFNSSAFVYALLYLPIGIAAQIEGKKNSRSY